MMTEDEARTKWCPMVRFVAHDSDSGANRWAKFGTEVATNPSSCRCIASDCMMWRVDRSTDGPRGYCGLAGKPFIP